MSSIGLQFIERLNKNFNILTDIDNGIGFIRKDSIDISLQYLVSFHNIHAFNLHCFLKVKLVTNRLAFSILKAKQEVMIFFKKFIS